MSGGARSGVVDVALAGVADVGWSSKMLGAVSGMWVLTVIVPEASAVWSVSESECQASLPC